jgi:hypothetical protein
LAVTHRQIFDAAGPVPSADADHGMSRMSRIRIDRAVLLAGHAECPTCGAFVRRPTPLGSRSVVGELFAGYCTVCCNTTYFATAS